MKRFVSLVFGGLVGLGALAFSLSAADLVVHKTRNDAVAAAKANDKLILLISGRKDCTFCAAMKSKILTEGTPERTIIDQAYEFWDCPQDEGCNTHTEYAGGAYTLPLSCLIDPYFPRQYLERRFGNVTDLPGWMKLGMLKGSVPVAANLSSNQPVFNADFTVQGHSRWPALFVDWSVNQAGVWCRLNGNAWARGTVTGKTNWSFPFNPAHVRPGSNVFQAYFRDSDFNYSQTNTIRFSFGLGASVTITGPANHQFHPTNAVTVTGTAQSVGVVGAVRYRFNGGAWEPAQGTTSWTVPLTLEPGANQFEVYAEDVGGTRSATNLLTMTHFLGAPLALQIIGLGGVAPAGLTNSWLFLTTNYTVAATGSNGFGFNRWEVYTNGFANGLTSNKTTANLTFVMQTNLALRAVFVDTEPPTVLITNLGLDGRVSNALFTVRGTASDNVGVSNVFYRFGPNTNWTLASGTTAWAATPLQPLAPGENRFEVYAEDTNGVKRTQSRMLTFVVSDTLEVRQRGLGTIDPNYNGADLEIGAALSMTATPATGFQFVRWEMSTNWLNPVVVTTPTLNFTMRTNLTLEVVFVDTNRPTIMITAPVASQKVSNSVLTARGSATDNAGVSNVVYRLNGVGWSNATGTTSWEAAGLVLKPGTNVFEAYAEDTVGLRSPTATVTFQHIPSALLQVTKVGQGSYAPNYNNALLAVGTNYTMTATGSNGHRFDHWEVYLGQVLASNKTAASLTFAMRTNLSLKVFFVDTNRPVLGVTNLVKQGTLPLPLVWDPYFMVRGTNRDNVGVTGVSVQLTNRVGGGVGPWRTNEVGLSNQWSAPLDVAVLRPGTNTFRVYALDAVGNTSSVISTNFLFPLKSVRLPVEVVGPAGVPVPGAVWPNYSNLFLAIGTNYVMTATGSNGCIFQQWVVTSNGVPVLITNNPRLSFIMQSNLAARAEFEGTGPPVFVNCPQATVVSNTAPGRCDRVVTYVILATNQSGSVPVVCVPPSGTTFQKGPTQVICTATDQLGISNVCGFTVSVVDNEKPVFTVCPSPITVNTAPGRCDQVVTLAATATDNCGGHSVVCVPASGSPFQRGTTNVTCTATDGAGNTAECRFTVTVVDNEKPQIACPGNLVTNTAAGQCDQVVSFMVPATDNCGNVQASCAPASGSRLTKGTHPVTCTVSDSSGNTNTCSFTVTVQDEQAPQVTQWPTNRVLLLGSNCSLTVPDLAAEVIAADNCGSVTKTQTPPAGGPLALGANVVNVTLADASGNRTNWQVTITVNPQRQPVVLDGRQVPNTTNGWLVLSLHELLAQHPSGRAITNVIETETVTQEGGHVYPDYYPGHLVYFWPHGFVGVDSFALTNQDCAGVTVVDTVQITVEGDGSPQPLRQETPVIATGSGTDRVLSITLTNGIGGYRYTLRLTTNLFRGTSRNWVPVQVGHAGPDGTVVFSVTNPPSRVFFKTTSP